MHLIAIRHLRTDAAQHPDVIKQIDNWYATVKKAEWGNLEDVRKIYRDAEAVGNFTVYSSLEYVHTLYNRANVCK